MKTKQIIPTVLLLLLSFASFAQSSKPTDAAKQEEYNNKVRSILQLDYSMPDYTTTKVDAKVMGPRLAKIINKILADAKQPENLTKLSALQSDQIDDLNYCFIEKISFKEVSKKGSEIKIDFNTTLKPNNKKVTSSILSFVFADGVSEIKATNDYFVNVCKYLKEQ